MTIDNCNRTREMLAAFQDDELSCELSYSIQEHLNQCRGCRGFADLEKGFNDAMRSRLGRLEAPADLFDRSLRRLDLVDRLEVGEDIEHVIPPRGRHPARVAPDRFIRALYAAAAVLIAGALLIPVAELYRFDVSRGLLHWAAGVEHARGVIVCVECARHGVPIDRQRECRAQGHVTGIECEETGLWHLVASEASYAVMSDPSMRGQEVEVEGAFHRDIRYIDARAITVASR